RFFLTVPAPTQTYTLSLHDALPIAFGVLDRNWGPSGIQGLLLSDNPYSLASLALTIGTPHINLQGLATQLDTRSDPTGTPVNRYMVQHRLLIRPKGPWTAALWEASVLSGVGRQLEPWYLDIVQVGLVQASNTNTRANFFAGLDFQREGGVSRSEEHTSELQSLAYLVCRLLLEKKKKKKKKQSK